MPTIVTAEEIALRFDALLSGAATREEVEDWAWVRMKASDANDLQFEPSSDEDRLWRAVTYLSGVGLRTDPNTYLHSQEDFEAFRRQLDL